MKVWIGVTDGNWFEFLRERRPDEVNFWQPSSARQFRALQPGEPFLFKLHSPRNYIVGGGFFVRHSSLPCSLAWSAFGDKNGVASAEEFRRRIQKYRRSESLDRDPTIGCSILTEPFFWSEDQWIPVPDDWAPNIVQGKTYNTTQKPGDVLWNEVFARLAMDSPDRQADAERRYGRDYLTRARLGQGAFRVLVTEAYEKRCAISGERTLPVLQASHIQPYALDGPNQVTNGLLLRSDLHILFDGGYVTVTPDLRVEVSKRIKEEFENGRDYYAYAGRRLAIVPGSSSERPASKFLAWHNEHVYERRGLDAFVDDDRR